MTTRLHSGSEMVSVTFAPRATGQVEKSELDHGMAGIVLHILGDAANNIGVIIAAAVIWLAKYPGRYYADPAMSMVIGVIITLSCVPLCKSCGRKPGVIRNAKADSLPSETNRRHASRQYPV